MAELLFVQMQTRAASWRLSEGKQVLAAKCAFSEQRNDCYVLAAVITGTLPRARLPLQQRVLLLWMERLLHREGFDSLHVQQMAGNKHSGAAVSSFPMAHLLPADSERRSDASFFKASADIWLSSSTWRFLKSSSHQHGSWLRCVWAGGGMWLACVMGGTSCCKL